MLDIPTPQNKDVSMAPLLLRHIITGDFIYSPGE